ncbi:MAG TPA: ATP-binding protein [Nitrososphaeraceae archaeon]|nr:ATP-binding protein [Nitrososphaeraceae archaeon]
MLLNFLLRNNDKIFHIFTYLILPSISLSIIALVSTTNLSLWITSPRDHFYFELFGTILAGILAFYYLSRAKTLNDKFSLFIGIGFLVNALIDLLHATVSLLNMNDILFLKYFIPQTWFAGRLFLSAMLAIAIVRYTSFLSVSSSTHQQKQKQQQQQQKSSTNNNRNYKLSRLFLLYLIIVTLFSSAVAISSLYIIFPYSVIDDIPIHRPYELFPLALFLISLYYFYRNKIYKNKDIFYTSLVISIILDIFGQIIMSFSAQHFDTAHNMAHILKDSGYFINIIGLALSSIQYNLRLRESNDRLRESNEMLTIQYQKVKESEKMKTEFINIAAHELRTPIQPILGLSDIIYSKVKDEELHELLEIIIRNAKRLKRLTDNLLDVTKIEGRSLMLNKEKFNLNILISEVLKDYVNKQKNQLIVKIVYDFKRKEDIIVEADRDRLSQVIHNLLDNALKFTTHNNQTIFVIIDKKNEGKEEKKVVIVSVKDTGEGIYEKILPKLFSKFSVSNSTTGTGLGLYICKNIIEAHDGKIWAENNSDENGATFSFTLPIAE